MLCHLQNAGIQLNDSVVSAINAGLKQIRKEKFEEHRKTSGIKTQVCMQKTRAHEGGVKGMEEKNTAPGGKDQERVVSKFGNTEVEVTKDRITLSVR